MIEQVKYVNNKIMRFGYTTGTCAAAASMAAVEMLLTGKRVEKVHISTPKGIDLDLTIENVHMEDGSVSCGVRKDAGDDPDTTNGVLVCSRVKKISEDILIDGGVGVGRVTQPGLDQPVGNAAINHVPRQMIRDNVARVCMENGYRGGIDVEIFVPEGEKVAEKTFNQYVGVLGGISILGTSGIVEPMSEKALIDSTHVELSVLRESGVPDLLLTIGNYGDAFAGNSLNIDLSKRVKCSNFIGETLNSAIALKYETLLLVGHIGKAVKLGAGIMNTHSHNADARMDILTTCALEAGADIDTMKKIMTCLTTDAALDVLEQAGILQPTMDELARRVESHLDRRLKGHMKYGVVIFTNNDKRSRVLCKCASADELMEKWRLKDDK